MFTGFEVVPIMRIVTNLIPDGIDQTTVLGDAKYRKYRSFGTIPRLPLQARLLHSQEDVETDRYVCLRKALDEVFRKPSFSACIDLVVKQLSLESQSRGCAKTPVLMFPGKHRSKRCKGLIEMGEVCALVHRPFHHTSTAHHPI